MRNVIFTLSDIKALFGKNKKKIFFIFTSSFFLMLAYQGCKTPVYKSEALYQIVETGQKEGSLLDRMLGSSGDEESMPLSLLQSQKVLVPVIQKLGLQVSVKEKTFFEKCFANCKRNLLAELFSLPLENKGFLFKDVTFLKRVERSFYLKMISHEKFEILSLNHEKLSRGTLGKKCSCVDGAFTLISVPKNLKLNKLYPFTLNPINKTYASLLKKIRIKEDDYASSLLKISCSYQSPYLSKKIVNKVISSYGSYLQKQADYLSEAEMSYLQKKREKLFVDLEDLLDKSICLQKDQLSHHLLFPIENKLDQMFEPIHQSKQKIAQIQAKLRTLTEKPSQYLCEGFSELNGLQKELDNLEGEKKLLTLSSYKESKNVPSFFSYLGLSFPSTIHEKTFPNELESLEGDIKKLKGLGQKDTKKLQHLTLKKKILQQRSQYSDYDKSFEGIDLNTAKGLLVSAFKSLDEAQSKALCLEQLKKQISLEKSLAPLSGHTKNPIFQQQIKKAEEIALEIQKNDLTLKEKKRLIIELSELKKNLKESLDYEGELEKLLQEKLFVKISKLQTLVEDLIDQKIALGDQKKQDLLASYQKELQWEKNFLESNLENIAEQMKQVPDQWKIEKELRIKTSMVMETLKSIGQVFEERSFLAQLKKIQSKPVDKASLFFIHERPLLFFLSFAFAFFSAFFTFIVIFYKKCFSGFPLTKELLKAYGKDVLVKNDLFEIADFIRKNLSKEKKVVTLIEDHEKYAKKLLALFMERGYKSIVVDGSGYLEEKGWIDHLENNCPLSIEKTKLGDFLFVGKKSESLLNNISSLAFLERIDTLKNEYDIIIIACDAPPLSLIARATLAFSDQVILPITDETYEEIEPYLLWEDKEKKLGFNLGR